MYKAWMPFPFLERRWQLSSVFNKSTLIWFWLLKKALCIYKGHFPTLRHFDSPIGCSTYGFWKCLSEFVHFTFRTNQNSTLTKILVFSSDNLLCRPVCQRKGRLDWFTEQVGGGEGFLRKPGRWRYGVSKILGGLTGVRYHWEIVSLSCISLSFNFSFLPSVSLICSPYQDLPHLVLLRQSFGSGQTQS